MNSTTTSEILSLEKLNIAFDVRHYRGGTLRQAFVNLLNDPVRAILRPRRSLQVLKDVSFRVHAGDRLGILGVNGSGKTTLCRCIAGMLAPDAGKVRLGGECRAIFSTTAGVIPELTGRENAELLARLLYPRETDSAVGAIVEDATRFSELGNFLDAPYETYSQGMKGRLCLSVLTAKGSDLLILDEVYENTDQFFQAKMMSRLDDMIHSSKAVLFVSHSRELIERTCNRAVVLHENRLVFDGSVKKALLAYELLNTSPA